MWNFTPTPPPRRFHLRAASPDSCTHANSSTCASGRTRQVQANPPPSPPLLLLAFE